MNSKELSVVEEEIEVLTEEAIIKKLVSGEITPNQARKLLGYKPIY